MFTFESIDELFTGVVDEIMTYGQETKPRGMLVREIRGVTLELTEPSRNMLYNRERKPNYSFMVAEWLWMRAGRKDVASIAAYNKEIGKFSDNGVDFFGAYGPKIHQQMSYVIALLQRDPDSRQAIISPWDPAALWTSTKDVPCTLTWQFFIRNQHLEMHVNMRSNDAWLGLPYDIFNFTQFQRELAEVLKVEVGTYLHHVGSLHLYEQHFEKAYKVAGAAAHNTDFSPTPVQVKSDLPNVLPYQLAVGRFQPAEYHVPRAWLRDLPLAWQEYLGLILYRFTKDVSDLGSFGRSLVGV